MLYRLVRPIARLFLRATFRKIYFHNKEVIPLNTPVILAANHPTAFIEPCILATHLDQDLHFIVRGDLFVKPFYTKLLKSLNMVPIFRLKDGGFQKLTKNYETFDFCFEALHENKTIMILAEGSTKHEKRLRPLRKGTARIAFGTYDKYGDIGLQIVPVGVNYSYADEARSDVMIEFGEPILLKDYISTYEREPNRAMREVLETLEERLRKVIIIIDEKSDEWLLEQSLILYRNNHPEKVVPVVVPSNRRLQNERRIASHLNKSREAEKTKLKELTRQYTKAIEEEGITDRGLVQPQYGNWKYTLMLIVGFLPFVLAFISNFIPFAIARYVKKTKVRHIEFKLSVWLAVAMFSYLLYWIGWLVTAAFINHWALWVWAIILPFWAYFVPVYFETYQRWKEARAAARISDDKRQDLMRQRARLMEELKI